jgi:hypothetical protein
MMKILVRLFSLIPHQLYIHDLSGVIYLAGRGDGSIKMLEIVDEDPYVHYLTEYSSNIPQIGVAPLPKQSLDIRSCEIARFLKLSDSNVEPIQMIVPRTRMEFFQDDIFPPTRANKPTYTSEEWLSGETRDPVLASVRPEGMPLLSEAPAVEKRSSALFGPSRVVDDTPSKEQVMTKFYQQVKLFKEDDSSTTTTTTTTPTEEDDEWA